MEGTTWYAIASGAALLLWLLCRVFAYLTSLLRLALTVVFLKHIAYPQLCQRSRLLDSATRLRVLSILTYVAGNIVCMMVRVRSLDSMGTRAGLLSLVNMIPLLAASRLSFISHILSVSLGTHAGTHEWVGRVAVFQALLHTVIPLLNRKPLTWELLTVSGVVASAALALLFLLSLKVVRRITYELFLRSHLLLSVVVVVAIWHHVSLKELSAKIFLYVGLSLWLLVTGLRWTRLIYRNLVFGRSWATARITKLDDILQIDVAVPRPWQVKAGQYIYLSIPWASISTMSFLQNHPFMITWWERDENGLSISLLVEPRSGFTSKLKERLEYPMRAIVDGPYGLNHDFVEYGTVVMFATGIGYAGLLPYLKELVMKYNDREARTQRVCVIWHLDKECHQEWVQRWMNKLFRVDAGFILDVTLYISRYFNSSRTNFGAEEPLGNRLKKEYNVPKIGQILENELRNRKGKIIITTCADTSTSDRVREVVLRNLTDDIRFVELEYQPTSHRVTSESDEMEFSCRGMA